MKKFNKIKFLPLLFLPSNLEEFMNSFLCLSYFLILSVYVNMPLVLFLSKCGQKWKDMCKWLNSHKYLRTNIHIDHAYYSFSDYNQSSLPLLQLCWCIHIPLLQLYYSRILDVIFNFSKCNFLSCLPSISMNPK